jgi:predicted heme/steroid binding protein/DMSO/TMAO reductase YedYZ heme-binding membrane subunit
MPQTFTPAELARFDGRDGRPAYVAVDGTVYDVSGSSTWRDGTHGPCEISSSAGRDLSAEIRVAPARMRAYVQQKPVVGALVQPKKPARAAVQAGLAALAVLVVAVPFVAMAIDGFNLPPAVFATLRTLALVAYSLLLLSVVIGAFRPALNRLYDAGRLQTFHQYVALTALLLALCHAGLILSQGIAGYQWPVVFGPTVVVLLIVTEATARLRSVMVSTWRWIHRINYALFGLVSAHALVLGYNLVTESWMRIIFLVYVAIAAVGLAYRVSLAARRAKEPAGIPANPK